MNSPQPIESGKSAILAIAEIKSLIAAFDRGDTSALDVLEAVRGAVALRVPAARKNWRVVRSRRRAA